MLSRVSSGPALVVCNTCRLSSVQREDASALLDDAAHYIHSVEGVVPYEHWPERVKNHVIVRTPPEGFTVERPRVAVTGGRPKRPSTVECHDHRFSEERAADGAATPPRSA